MPKLLSVLHLRLFETIPSRIVKKSLPSSRKKPLRFGRNRYRPIGLLEMIFTYLGQNISKIKGISLLHREFFWFGKLQNAVFATRLQFTRTCLSIPFPGFSKFLTAKETITAIKLIFFRRANFSESPVEFYEVVPAFFASFSFAFMEAWPRKYPLPDDLFRLEGQGLSMAKSPRSGSNVQNQRRLILSSACEWLFFLHIMSIPGQEMVQQVVLFADIVKHAATLPCFLPSFIVFVYWDYGHGFLFFGYNITSKPEQWKLFNDLLVVAVCGNLLYLLAKKRVHVAKCHAFLTSNTDHKKLPSGKTKPAICLYWASNVGKSSLINMP